MSGMGPEFTFQLALGQWTSARRSVEEFKRSGYRNWSMTHAFLADMGGFVLHPTDWVPFPLDARQVHYLVIQGYIPYSAVGLEERVINDKNKGDGIVRFITIGQILWFTVNSFARIAQHLPITTMELTILSFILCTVGTSYLWANKPMDVGSAIVLVPNTTLANILINAGDKAREPYKCTPLDFVGLDRSSWYLYWTYWINTVRSAHFMFPVKRGPIEMIPDDNFPSISRRARAVLFLFQAGSAAVHLSAWNFEFATPAERLIWRIASIYTLLAIVLYWPVDLYTWYVYPSDRQTILQTSTGGN
jgi:hypothetical protein